MIKVDSEALHAWVLEQLKNDKKSDEFSDEDLLAELERVTQDVRNMSAIFRSHRPAELPSKCSRQAMKKLARSVKLQSES